MRTAIATKLLTVTEFGNRVFAAFTAPSDTVKPYCTYKITEDNPSTNNKHGGFGGFQIFIYMPLGVSPDEIVTKVKKLFHNITLSTDDSPARFFVPEHIRTLADYKDEETSTLMKRMEFLIPQYRF
jgi:hypothetical protein